MQSIYFIPYTVGTVAADALAKEGARASIDIVITSVSRKITVLVQAGLNGWLFFIIITQVDFDERLNLNFTCCVQQVPWLTDCTNWLILDFSKREKLYNFRGLVITCTFNEWIPCLFTYAFSPSAREGALIGTWVQSIAPRIPGKPESRHAHINNHTLMHTYQPFHWAIMLSWEWGDSIVLQFVEPYTCMHLEKC